MDVARKVHRTGHVHVARGAQVLLHPGLRRLRRESGCEVLAAESGRYAFRVEGAAP